MRVLTFQPQFHDPVRSGQKTSTIRDKARCKPGDELSLRQWIGMPYRTKQKLLIPNQICTAVTTVRMEISKRGNFKFYIIPEDEGEPLEILLVCGNDVNGHAREIARREGFASWEAMRDWFISAKKIRLGKPYRGAQIEWKYSPQTT